MSEVATDEPNETVDVKHVPAPEPEPVKLDPVSINIFRERRDRIRSCTQDVEIPEWPDENGRPTVLKIRKLSEYEIEEWYEIGDKRRKAVENGQSGVAAHGTSAGVLVGLSLVNPDGSQMFNRAQIATEMKDVEKAVMDRLTDAVFELCGLRKIDTEKTEGK